MNMNSQINLITTDEYFAILNQEHLKPEDIIKKDSFEKYIKMCKEYEAFISPAAQSILSDYNAKIMAIGIKENKTSHEESVLKDFQSAFETQEKSLEQEGTVRKLAKAGYIDATIILTIILNVGFIVAMTLIGS